MTRWKSKNEVNVTEINNYQQKYEVFGIFLEVGINIERSAHRRRLANIGKSFGGEK